MHTTVHTPTYQTLSLYLSEMRKYHNEYFFIMMLTKFSVFMKSDVNMISDGPYRLTQ